MGEYFVGMYACALLMCLVPKEVRRWLQIRNSSYWLRATSIGARN